MLPFLAVLLVALWRWVWRLSRSDHSLAGERLPAEHAGHPRARRGRALDVPVTALCILSFYCLLRWLEPPTLARAALLGLATGLAIGTKISALPFIGVAGLALLVAQFLCTARATAHTRCASGSEARPWRC